MLGVFIVLRNFHCCTVQGQQTQQLAPPPPELEQIALDPVINKTGDVWHIKLDGLDVRNLYYGWRLEGDAGWEGLARVSTILVP